MSFIGNEVLPYLMDAADENVDISIKNEAISYVEMIGLKDKFAEPVIKYLKSLNESDYNKLWKLAIPPPD